MSPLRPRASARRRPGARVGRLGTRAGGRGGVTVALLLVAGLCSAFGPAAGGDGGRGRACHSIRPGAWKGIGRMLAAGGEELRKNAGPFVPDRSEEEERARVERFWAQGVRPLGKNGRGAPVFERLADGGRIIVVHGGRFDLGVPDRLRDEVAPVVVLTTCPAHVVKLPPGVALREDMVLRDPYPSHAADLPAFAMDETEVTWARYRRYQKEVLKRRRPRRLEWAGDDHPVTDVTWFEAAGYCDWVGGRLPTDAEWEHAARGPQGFAYPWGRGWPPPKAAGNFHDASLAAALCEPDRPGVPDDSYVYTSPVGSFPAGASPYGVLDVLGNASEWVEDWYDEVDRTVGPVARPCPPPHEGQRDRVVRGDSFFESSVLQREADQAWERSGDFPWRRDRTRGFRCAHDLPAEGLGAAPREIGPEPVPAPAVR